jgi:soluble lytic murein transglycosylase-like protein
MPKLLLKALIITESNLNPNAYRYEPAFWERYLKDNPIWCDKDPKVVSASYGLTQVMYVVAWENGFRRDAEELYDPVTNIGLGARILRKHNDEAIAEGVHIKTGLWPIKIALARYNGGKGGNPGADGKLRNQSYVDKVMKKWWELQENEEECFGHSN